jgi:hypothetical protein
MKFSPLLILCLSLIALFGCSGSPTSDEEKVRAVFASAEEAAEERDAGDVLELVDARYADAQGNSRDSLRPFLHGFFATHPKLELIVSVEELEFPVDGLARARVKVRGLELDRFSVGEAVLLNVELRHDGSDWRVVRADRASGG